MDNNMTKTEKKNTRWMLLEQRMTFIEQRVEDRLCRVECSVKELKDNEIKHLEESVAALRKENADRFEKLTEKITENKVAIAKIVAIVGALLTALNIALKVFG